MTNTAQALYAFFSSFDIPAYVEYTEPDDADPPYITYELAEPDWRSQGSIHARVWYRSTSFSEVDAMVDRIRAEIGECKSIPTPTGAVYLYADDNWAQFQPMEGDPTLKCAYLSFVIMAHTT